jgi:hypothetical protein
MKSRHDEVSASKPSAYMASHDDIFNIPPGPPDLSAGVGAVAGDDLHGSRTRSSAGASSTSWRVSLSAGPLTQPVSIDAIISLENWAAQAHTVHMDTSGRLKVVLTGAG